MYLDTIQLTAGISVGLSTITVTLKCFQDEIKIYRKVKSEIRKKSAKGVRKGALKCSDCAIVLTEIFRNIFRPCFKKSPILSKLHFT